jgi:hypothetical protein
MMRIRVLLLLLTLLVGGAVAAAQNGPASPNDVVEEAAEPANALPVEAMVGRSPNEVWGEEVAAAPAGDEREMEGRSPNEAGAETEVGAVAAGSGRRFLVTNTNVTGANADTSCPAGFHMASLWELHDVTALTYDQYVPNAKARSDMGTGPVAGWWAWVRTGNDAFNANLAGRANCDVWTSTTAGHYGTLARLAETWTAAGVAISPWQAQTWSCTGTAPVWCVAD